MMDDARRQAIRKALPLATPKQARKDITDLLAALAEAEAALAAVEQREAKLLNVLERCHEFAAHADVSSEWWKGVAAGLCDELDAARRGRE